MERSNLEAIKSAIESLLFISGEPLSFNKLLEILSVKAEDLRMALEELTQDYESQNRGLRLLSNNQHFSLVTSPLNSAYISKLIKFGLEGDLSPAAIETLAIIAYRGPLTRLEIDEIRGVNSFYILRTLLLRGLIEREINPQRANAFIYYVSDDFLKFLGITNINQLPNYEKFKRQ